MSFIVKTYYAGRATPFISSPGGNRDMVDANDLLKIVLVLVVIWLGLEVLDFVIGALLGPLDSIIGLLLIVLIVLFLLDRI